MVELVMVLVVAGILMSIAAPVLSAGRWRADVGAQELAAGLGAAQRLAVLRQHDVVVTFLMDERSLEVHRDADNDGVVDAGEDVRRIELPETVGFGFGGAPGLEGDTDPVTFEDPGTGPRLVFHRNGSASEDGRAYLRPMEGSMSAESVATRALTVERSTGEVRCFSYRTGTWEAAC